MRTKATLSTPPDDSLSDDFTSCSEWAERKFNETGNTDYLELYNQWKEREDNGQFKQRVTRNQ